MTNSTFLKLEKHIFLRYENKIFVLHLKRKGDRDA